MTYGLKQSYSFYNLNCLFFNSNFSTSGARDGVTTTELGILGEGDGHILQADHQNVESAAPEYIQIWSHMPFKLSCSNINIDWLINMHHFCLCVVKLIWVWKGLNSRIGAFCQDLFPADLFPGAVKSSSQNYNHQKYPGHILKENSAAVNFLWIPRM